MESMSKSLGASDSIPISYRPRGTGDRCRRSQNGFYTPWLWSRRVWSSLYLQLEILGQKIEIESTL